MVKVKKEGKVFVGKVAAVGGKADVEVQISELDANRRGHRLILMVS